MVVFPYPEPIVPGSQSLIYHQFYTDPNFTKDLSSLIFSFLGLPVRKHQTSANEITHILENIKHKDPINTLEKFKTVTSEQLEIYREKYQHKLPDEKLEIIHSAITEQQINTALKEFELSDSIIRPKPLGPFSSEQFKNFQKNMQIH